MSNDDRREGTMTERDHPQTRKAEPDARGSSAWRDDVEPPAGDDEKSGQEAAEQGREQASADSAADAETDAQLGDDADAVRAHAQGFRTIGESVGGGAGLDVGSGTSGDKGGLGGGGSGGGRG